MQIGIITYLGKFNESSINIKLQNKFNELEKQGNYTAENFKNLIQEELANEQAYLTNLRNQVGVFNSINLVNGILRLDEVFAFNSSVGNIELKNAFIAKLKELSEPELTKLIKNSVLAYEIIPKHNAVYDPKITYNILLEIAEEKNFEGLKGILSKTIKILEEDYLINLKTLNLRQIYNLQETFKHAKEQGFATFAYSKLKDIEETIENLESGIIENINSNFKETHLLTKVNGGKENYIQYLAYIFNNYKNVDDLFAVIRTMDEKMADSGIKPRDSRQYLTNKYLQLFLEYDMPEALIFSANCLSAVEVLKYGDYDTYFTEEQLYKGYTGLIPIPIFIITYYIDNLVDFL